MKRVYYQKIKQIPHTLLSSVIFNWHGAVCLLVRDKKKAGDSVKQTLSVSRLKSSWDKQ